MNSRDATVLLITLAAWLPVVLLLLWRIRRLKLERSALTTPATQSGDNDPVIVSQEAEWLYEKAPRNNAQVLLLTTGDVAVRGFWRGELGEYFKAWHPIPKRNKQRERELGLLYSERR